MEPFIYLIKYLISIKLKFGLIVICNNEACVISRAQIFMTWHIFYLTSFSIPKLISIRF
jgi:hypothetical protein